MSTYGFNDVDIDCEYPASPDYSGRGIGYDNIVYFIKKLWMRMSQHKKGVLMPIPASYWYLQHFDITSLESTVDWFSLMSCDMHGA